MLNYVIKYIQGRNGLRIIINHANHFPIQATPHHHRGHVIHLFGVRTYTPLV